jgi:amino acid adenylation domain-containing protein
MDIKKIADIYPLSPVQEDLLRKSLDCAPSGSIIHLSCVLKGELQFSLLALAFQEVVNRHPILRTSFAWKRLERPMQLVHRELSVLPERPDPQCITRAWQEADLATFLQSDWIEGFNPAEPGLLRYALFHLDDESHRFLLGCHRLILDELSLHFILRETVQFYRALQAGAQLGRKQEQNQFRHYVKWLKSCDISATESFWRQHLEGLEAPTPLVIDAGPEPSPTVLQNRQTQVFQLTEALTEGLQLFIREHQLSSDIMLEGAWSWLLSRYSGEEDVAVGITIRHSPAELPESASLIGPLTNTLPARVRVEENAQLLTWLKGLSARVEEIRRHGHSSLSQVKEWIKGHPERSLFESVLALDARAIDELQEGAKVAPEMVDAHSFELARFPLMLKLRHGSRFSLEASYDCRRFAQSSIARLLEHIQNILAAMIDKPEQRLRDIAYLSGEELHQLLLGWNQTRAPYPSRQCIHELFEQQAARTPDAMAVVSSCGKDLSYRDLNGQANRLAHYLRKFGVGPDVPVCVCLERSVEMIVAILSVLKAGGAYVPLDPAYPLERLSLLLEETGATMVLTRQRLADALPAQSAMTVCLDADDELLAHESAENPRHQTSPDNLAYIMYTSGSTGVPKGVSITHRGVVRLVKRSNYASLTAAEVIPQLAPLSFDASTFEIWGSLLNGARLVILPEQTLSLEELGHALEQFKVTTMWLTAGLFHMMVESNPESLKNLRQLLSGGDVLSAPHVRKALTALKGCRLINGYGPTENTTFTCCHSMTDAPEVKDSVSIGLPVSNTQVYVLDDQLRPVPVGVSGELYAGGDGLARGYFKRPELTAEKFIPHPFSQHPGERLYKTGDVVKRTEDGRLEFLDRLDSQLKIRGYRIEPGEVEAVVRQQSEVQDVAVVARADGMDEKRLVAYIVMAPERALSVTELRARLRDKLPEYMIPAFFVALEALPLTSNGKVDRRALPDPEMQRPDLELTFVAPRTPLEQAMADIWAEVLHIESVGIEDNFFELGGHSLLATQLISRLRDAFQVEVPLHALFDQPTIAALASIVEELLINEINSLTDDEAQRALQSFEHI